MAEFYIYHLVKNEADVVGALVTVGQAAVRGTVLNFAMSF
jgi:hypothetical protein